MRRKQWGILENVDYGWVCHLMIFFLEAYIWELKVRLDGSCHRKQRKHTWDFISYKMLLMIIAYFLLSYFKSNASIFGCFLKLSTFQFISFLYVKYVKYIFGNKIILTVFFFEKCKVHEIIHKSSLFQFAFLMSKELKQKLLGGII